MPTVAREGEFAFVVHTREFPFEPSHVHVRLGDGTEVRIELAGGTFMRPDEFKVPPGKRRAILEAYRRHAAEILKVWSEIHGRR
jgi:hypothetical protein